MSQEFRIRSMEPADWAEVADLICLSTNYWYQAQGKPAIFTAGPTATRLFCEVYEDLDPGCCLLAENVATKRLMGSCFYHPRDTHWSLGIMNAHPNYFRAGVARSLLTEIVRRATELRKPVRLVSSAMNLDSYSLYTRAGFVPRQLFQDMYLRVPDEGLPPSTVSGVELRDARLDDVPSIAKLERQIAGIVREQDYRYFIENRAGYWHTSVAQRADGTLAGFLASIAHPGSTMIGPGFAVDQTIAGALLLRELDARRGCTPVFLLPVDAADLVRQAYQWGAKNCEMHVAQVYGEWQPFQGIVLPTFMPETG